MIDPELRPETTDFSSSPFPSWRWKLKGGDLLFSVQPGTPGGIRLVWRWNARAAGPSVPLRIRLLGGGRGLHSMGGKEWIWKELAPGRAQMTVRSGAALQCRLDGAWKWEPSPVWYERFHYSEEVLRGYDSDEDLYSAGELITELKPMATVSLALAEDPNDLEASPKSEARKAKPNPVLDFVVTRPAGIVAGYPWFGEWGRDTFASLPGVVAGRIEQKEDPAAVMVWARECLQRWGRWIQSDGMLPNVIGENGQPQWESSDATLWWCHGLASLWAFSLAGYEPLASVQTEFAGQLKQAIAAIESGQHRFLRMASDGLLEVTEPHSTWMDARVGGVAVTPRTGKLPEINALWFQARCLHALWSKPQDSQDSKALMELGRAALGCQEPDRPNGIFLHSLPLAPSFVLEAHERLLEDLSDIARKFWTPVGLRSLNPEHPEFQARCLGTQEQRDRAYHQGPVWGWLGGHYEMARARLKAHAASALPFTDKMFSPDLLREMPIPGHIPEIFDAEPPFAPRGAPAQAWSLACLEEANARRRWRLDSKVAAALAPLTDSQPKKSRRTAKRRPSGGEVEL